MDDALLSTDYRLTRRSKLGAIVTEENGAQTVKLDSYILFQHNEDGSLQVTIKGMSPDELYIASGSLLREAINFSNLQEAQAMALDKRKNIETARSINDIAGQLEAERKRGRN